MQHCLSDLEIILFDVSNHKYTKVTLFLYLAECFEFFVFDTIILDEQKLQNGIVFAEI